MSTTERPRILVVGGGYVGLYAAHRILKKMRYGEATVTVVDPRSYMTYQPFLPEAAAGSISPRHVVVPLRRVLPKAEVLTGRVTTIDQDRKVATIAPLVGEAYDLPFDYLVIALGAVSRTFPIPGLAENGIGMKGVEEAIGLRNHVLEQLDKADSTHDEDVRRRALTFVFVGGGFAGAETIGEVEDMARDAAEYYPNVRREDMRFILVDAAPGSSPRSARSSASGAWSTSRAGASRSISAPRWTPASAATSCSRTASRSTPAPSCGRPASSRTRRWPASVCRSAPRATWTSTPPCRSAARTTSGPPGTTHRCPDLAAGKDGPAFCPPNAQHALRQAKALGDNVISALRGFPQRDYKHANKGAVAGLGPAQGRRDDRPRQARASSSRAVSPGTCTAATTVWRCRPGTARSASSPTGRSACSSSARSSPSARWSTRARSSTRRPRPSPRPRRTRPLRSARPG